MKKLNLILAGILALSVLTGCSLFNKPPMDELNKEGVYNYRNEGLKFSLELTAEFLYYQTQSKDADGYRDIEFFVPTSDKSIPQEVPGYAKPIVIRAYEEEKWKELADKERSNVNFEELKAGNNRIYLIKFWDQAPADWQDKWTSKMREDIKSSFKLD
ncbi:MAG: hypothetical protein WCW77_02480 [Patescibacteria group bacterium]|jgi:hypothetical protein